MTMLALNALEAAINSAWETRANLDTSDDSPLWPAISQLMSQLDRGELRVASRDGTGWRVNEWIKKGILLSFKLHDNVRITGGAGGGAWYDKVPSKFMHWNEETFKEAGFRAVPGAIVRHSAYISKGVVLMPCFINVGAFVGENTMIDTWSTVGSCAQVGARVHVSGGVGIGGVLEPLQASPVIIEDDCFIGARSEIAEGMIVERGAVISMGVFLGASTKIIDRATGEVFQGRVPAYSVVVPGTLPGKPMANGQPGPGLSCAVIVKRVDEKTRSKTSINELLRD